MDNNFEKLNIHDPHTEHVWADTTPAWVTLLKVAGFIAGGIGLFIVVSLTAIILMQL